MNSKVKKKKKHNPISDPELPRKHPTPTPMYKLEMNQDLKIEKKVDRSLISSHPYFIIHHILFLELCFFLTVTVRGPTLTKFKLSLIDKDPIKLSLRSSLKFDHIDPIQEFNHKTILSISNHASARATSTTYVSFFRGSSSSLTSWFLFYHQSNRFRS